MSCVNCSNAVEKVVKKIDGVSNANVSFASSYGEFEVRDTKVADKVRQKIEKLGYEIATNYEELEEKKAKNLKILQSKLILSVILSTVLMVLHMFLNHSFLNLMLQFLISFVVIFYCGKNFFTNAFKALKNINFDMNVLVSLGVFSSFTYSTFVLVFNKFIEQKFINFYFESACMIVTFILIGKFLEEKSKLKANDYIKTLLDLTPKIALLIKSDGTSEEILASNLKLDDVVIVKSGMNIPGDGIIIEGGAEIDTSILSGESMPVFRGVGDFVNAGCINTNGVINIKITKQNHETLLARMTKLLSEANAKKMPISRLTDKVANIFVPFVICISFFTFLIWFLVGNISNAIMCAISVLVISCPCALGLAVPISIVCALSNLAKNGVLVKNPEILENLKDVKNIIFDKTGTLTKGEITVYSTNLSDDILNEVANIELLSEHLISKAVVNFAKNKNLKIKKPNVEFENLIGFGIKAGEILVGNLELLNKFGVIVKNDFQRYLDSGFGVILVAKNLKYEGFIILSDELNSSAKELLNFLRKENINSAMLTGDNEKVANFIAEKLNIDKIYANALPQDKSKIVEKYRQNQGFTIFVGDGVNDGLSLKMADVGIAMSGGSDIAKGAGDAILIGNNLLGIKNLIISSNKTMKIIKQNLFWAFFYNIFCIPLATGLFFKFGFYLEPYFAALAMSFSSIFVVLNSLKLKYKKLLYS
ncbi:cation-translocating P-type ATPase [Campylobacter sp. FMV-PI01]|uniref:Copper-transporting ATPase n=2 Tax=Campylobacter portucalensis TaxID=2608384 RepID=A0A6L5WJC5_9BACT|nr:cation-translocating P-type ATPase [Campylobacter portucalensis]